MSSKFRSKILKEILKAVMTNEFNNLYEFADCRFDGKKGKLWRNNELILLSPKAAELLNLLLEKNGEYVSKEEIFEQVWKDTFVEDGVLTQNIYTLRKALGRDAEGQNIIENKTRFGYRITVPINRTAQTNGNQTDISAAPLFDEIAPVQPTKPKRKLLKAVLIVGAVLLIAAGFTGWRFFRPQIRAFFRKPIESVKFSQLTNTGNVTNAALSPDGKFLAFARDNKVFLKDLASNREIPLDIPNARRFSFLCFSSDGNSIYFRDNTARYAMARILKTSRFGGEATVLAENSFGGFSLSPDNKFLAYYKQEKSDVNQLTVKNLETKEEKTLYETLFSGMFNSEVAPSLSPDGKKILQINQWWGSLAGQIFVIDVETGKTEEIKLPRLRRYGQAAWFPDGQSFVISASEDGRYFHLWKVSYPDGDAQALTVGLTSYTQPFISADGRKILALQSVVNTNLFVANAENLNEQKQITSGNTNRHGLLSLVWADDQRIVFATQNETEAVENLWVIDSEGRSSKQITRETGFSANTPSSDGKFAYYNINRNRAANINKVSLNGESVSEVTNESIGNRRSPQVTADGNWMYYVLLDVSGGKIMRRNLSEQKEEVFLENGNVQCGIFLALSPDEKHLACFNSRPNQNLSEKYSAEIAVISTEDKSVKFMQVDGNRFPLRFAPDSKSLEFTNNLDTGIQILRQGFDEPESKVILQMPQNYIFNFAWSKNGKQLALSRGQRLQDAVLLTEFDK